MKFKAKGVDSPARIALAELLESRSAAAGEKREAEARVSRLASLANCAAEPRAALARLDAAEAQAFAEWAKDSTLPVPSPDAAGRADLQRQVAEAEAKSGAAQRAVDGMSHESAATGQKLAAIEAQLPLAAAQVALEICPLIANEAREAVAAFHQARIRVAALRQIFTIEQQKADQTAPGFAEFTAESVASIQAMLDATNVPNDTGWESSFAGAVNDFLVRLTSDAAAQFEPPVRPSGQQGLSAGVLHAIEMSANDRVAAITREMDAITRPI